MYVEGRYRLSHLFISPCEAQVGISGYLVGIELLARIWKYLEANMEVSKVPPRGLPYTAGYHLQYMQFRS